MNNAPAILRSLIIYAICVLLAIFVGYLLTNPMDYSTLGVFAILAALLVSPVLLRWHHPLLIITWNLGISMFFIPGAPRLSLVMVVLSLGIAVLERTLNRERQFIHVPQVTWPLLCLAGVALMTARLTGGFGLRALGSDVYGGKKYVFLMIGILSYFAMTSRRIPPERAVLYMTLYFLGGVTSFIGDLFPIAPSWTHFVFWFFPPSTNTFSSFQVGETRLGGFAGTGTSIWCLLMARYGIRGIFLSGKLWRLFVFFLSFSMVFLGGFRSGFITLGLIFIFQFFLEGLHRTRLLMVFSLVGILAAVAIIPLAPKLPYTVQRTLAFLPLNLDSEAVASAQNSTDWRLNMWRALLPQVPQHLLLGKGLAISPEEYNEMMGNTALATATGQFDPSQDPLALAFDYHNGPLSVIIPFGIWGAIAFLWFVVAGIRVLYCNFRYGDPSLQTINLFLFVNFLVSMIVFMTLYGAVTNEMMGFAGAVGLSISLNGGVCQPAPRPAQADRSLSPAEPFPRLRPGFQR